MEGARERGRAGSWAGVVCGVAVLGLSGVAHGQLIGPVPEKPKPLPAYEPVTAREAGSGKPMLVTTTPKFTLVERENGRLKLLEQSVEYAALNRWLDSIGPEAFTAREQIKQTMKDRREQQQHKLLENVDKAFWLKAKMIELKTTEDPALLREAGDNARAILVLPLLIEQLRTESAIAPIVAQSLADAALEYRKAMGDDARAAFPPNDRRGLVIEPQRRAILNNLAEPMAFLDEMVLMVSAKWPALKTTLGLTDKQQAEIAEHEAALAGAKDDAARTAVMNAIMLKLSGQQQLTLLKTVADTE